MVAARQACTTVNGQVAQFHRLTSGQRFDAARRITMLESRLAALTAERDTAAGYLDPLFNNSLPNITTARSLPHLRLTVPTITAPNGALRHGMPALQRMNGLMAGATVNTWAPTVWPNPRAGVRPGPPGQYLLPEIDIVVDNVAPAISATGSLRLRVGPEILVDWLYPNPAHGLAYGALKDRAEWVLNTTNRNYAIFEPSLVPSGHNWRVECRNFTFQLILNGARNMIITYYS